MDKTDLIHRIPVSRPTAVTARPELALTVAVPTAGILLAEGFLFHGQIRLALLVHLLLLFGCLLAPVVMSHDATLYYVFMLVPLFRLLNFGMPIFFESTLSRLWIIYGVILFAIYDVAYVVPETELPDMEDVRRMFKNVPMAVIVAGVLASIENLILQPATFIKSWTSPDFLIFVIVMVVFVGFGEEFLFRGVLQETLAERVGAFPAIGLSALIFGVMYSPHGVLTGIGFGVTSGLVFGYVYHWSDNVLLVALIHGASNVYLFALLP